MQRAISCEEKEVQQHQTNKSPENDTCCYIMAASSKLVRKGGKQGCSGVRNPHVSDCNVFFLCLNDQIPCCSGFQILACLKGPGYSRACWRPGLWCAREWLPFSSCDVLVTPHTVATPADNDLVSSLLGSTHALSSLVTLTYGGP